ncbi:MAG: DUF1080 domain-containing protein, partial [Candidatus Omnitrophica bacterium]|nr:DUF1080 domain-containing protein [Candidatus Omnitrophota bacterium]
AGLEISLQVRPEILVEAGGEGPKLIADEPSFSEGEVGVEVLFPDANAGNAGLIVKVAEAGLGADRFTGYEVALDPHTKSLRLGRHRQDFELIRDTRCNVPIGKWIPLRVKLEPTSLEIYVGNTNVLTYEDREHPLDRGQVGLRTWQRPAQFRNLWVRTAGKQVDLAFEPVPQPVNGEVSRMWRPFQRGAVRGGFGIDKTNPFLGAQSQRLSLADGQGEIGIENQGLNRWGMHFETGKPYEGCLCVKTGQSTEFYVSLESADGKIIYAETRLEAMPGDWHRIDFQLTPNQADTAGRFAIKLKQPGSVLLGYAFLQPGEWGRFKGLPVRKDVAEALIDQGITVLRYGGSMVNHPEYRWKKMIGPRDRRPPYRGTWYPYSSNGWGIPDFMAFCEAAGFEYIPAFNMGESPQDMGDFIEFAKGPADSKWGQRRVADGHPQPYRLHYLELGNEERVDEEYAARFEAMAKAIWAKDPNIVLVVGDFLYSQPILNPFNFQGAASDITSLAGQQRILQLAKQHNREVWFDVHVGTDGPLPDSTLAGMWSFRNALDKISDGARHKVVVFEFNAGNHSQRRALANAVAIQAVERDGRIPIATSANCLQPDGQNDNGWNQGLLFLDPSHVWLQPPGYVTQMLSRNYLPQLVHCQVTGATNSLDANAKRSKDRKFLLLQVVNPTDNEISAQIHITGFTPANPVAQVTELSGPLNAVNTSSEPDNLVPVSSQWNHRITDGNTSRAFPPHSFTLIRFE